MLCAPASPVKYEGKPTQNQCQAQTWQPDLKELRQPVTFGRNADLVAPYEVHLRSQEGRGYGQQGQGSKDARTALVYMGVHHGTAGRR
jgi:hypothetical protein